MPADAVPRSRARAVETTSLPASAVTAARARAFVVDTLRGWHVATDALDDAELVVSELVTNAFLHGHADRVGVALADHGEVVLMEVTHREAGRTGSATAASAATAGPLTPLTAGADDTHGRGLAIVDVLSRAWGVEETDGDRRVWAELGAARAGLVRRDERDAVLAELAAVLGDPTDARGLGDAVTSWARERLATSFAGVALVEPDGEHLRYLSVVPLPPASAAAWGRFPSSADAPVAAAYREGRAFFHESRSAVVATFPDLGPALVASQMAALVHLPLVDGDRSDGPAPFGTLALAWEHGRELDAGDRRWLATAAADVARAFVRLGATRAAG